MKDSLIRADGITHDYGDGIGAIDISFEVNPGEIVGFIGPNGAGKTTTMRMIMGFIEIQKGKLQLFGESINTEADRLKLSSQIGFLPAESGYYSGFNAKQLFKYASSFYSKTFLDQAMQMASDLSLDTRKKIRDLSTGNQRKVGVILSLLHNPKLVILDEPTSGLDPLIQQKVLKQISKIKESGGAVFLSSHVLSEVERVCDRIIMIKDGNIILEDNTDNILATALKRFRIINKKNGIKAKLEKIEEVESVSESANDLVVYTNSTKPVLELLHKEGIYDFYLERPTLEEMFLFQYE